jgi:hypothetical protein
LSLSSPFLAFIPPLKPQFWSDVLSLQTLSIFWHSKNNVKCYSNTISFCPQIKGYGHTQWVGSEKDLFLVSCNPKWITHTCQNCIDLPCPHFSSEIFLSFMKFQIYSLSSNPWMLKCSVQCSSSSNLIKAPDFKPLWQNIWFQLILPSLGMFVYISC